MTRKKEKPERNDIKIIASDVFMNLSFALSCLETKEQIERFAKANNVNLKELHIVNTALRTSFLLCLAKVFDEGKDTSNIFVLAKQLDLNDISENSKVYERICGKYKKFKENLQEYRSHGLCHTIYGITHYTAKNNDPQPSYREMIFELIGMCLVADETLAYKYFERNEANDNFGKNIEIGRGQTIYVPYIGGFERLIGCLHVL